MVKDAQRTSRILAAILIAVLFLICGATGVVLGRPYIWPSAVPAAPSADQSPTPAFAIALNPVTPTVAATQARGVEPEPLMPVFSGSQSQGSPAGESRPDGLWQTPVRCEKSFNEKSSWLICEPGVILDDTAAWTIPGTKEHWFINVPEGGFTDFSMGKGVISIDGVSLVLPGEKGLNYEVVIRGRIDDGIVDRDLNMTAEISGFVVGHAIWSIMPPGAYVSHDWFRDQLVVSTTTGGTNCGATGCSRVRIVLFDVDSHFYQMFETHAGDIDSWTLLSEK